MESFEPKIFPNLSSYPKGLRSFERRHQNLDYWETYFLKKTNKLPSCEICGKLLKYFSGVITRSVHFDHKKSNLSIKSPYSWLANHKPTPKNITIWESCNFGILCNRCNRIFPTKNRKIWIRKQIRWLKKAIQYTNKI